MSRIASRHTVSNAERLVQYLAENELATAADMLHDQLMSAQEVSEALQYCIRHGVIGRTRRTASAPGQRVIYALTGAPLKVESRPQFSFDALLQAWGVATKAPEIRSDCVTRRLILEGCAA